MCAFASADTKWTVKAVKVLSETDPSEPCELYVHVTEDNCGWGLGSTLWTVCLSHWPRCIGYQHSLPQAEDSVGCSLSVGCAFDL